MNTGIIELLAFGIVAITAGILLLITLVRELAPADRRKWLLGIALGSGVITFSMKIALVAVLSAFPDQTLDLFPKKAYRQVIRPSNGSDRIEPQHRTRQVSHVWQALPKTPSHPAGNPPTAEKIALGKRLFFDKRLSADGTLSCASCHALTDDMGGGDGEPTSIGIQGKRGDRNAPTVLNAAFQRVLFWDGRASSLEEQAKGPLVNEVEMGMPSLASVEQRVREDAEYRIAFADVFPDEPINIDNITKAIATYERTLVTPDSAYDRFVNGEAEALTESQLRGMALFESVGCIHCHSGPNFSGAGMYTNNAAYRIFPAFADPELETRYRLTDDLGAASALTASTKGIWRIPSLRNVSRTAPYFHNGSVESLEEAVRIMARLQLNRSLSNRISDDRSIYWSSDQRQLVTMDNQALSDDEVKDIVAFLGALDGTLPEDG